LVLVFTYNLYIKFKTSAHPVHLI